MQSIQHKNFFVVTVVNTWMKLQDDRRTEAMHAAFVLLMSDFLFSNIALPEHWLRRLVDLKMLKISKSNKTLVKKYRIHRIFWTSY